MLEHTRPLDVLEPAVDEADVANGGVLEPAQIERVLALFAGDVPHLDVAHNGRERALRPFFVIEVDGEHRVGDLADLDVAHVNVLEEPAPHGVVLEPERAVESRDVTSKKSK